MTDTEIKESAIKIIADNKKAFSVAIGFEGKGRKAMVTAFETLIPQVEKFVEINGLKLEKAWSKFFQPELELQFGKRGFSFSTYKVYRGIKDNPDKKEKYLSGAINLSPERQKINKEVVDDITTLKTLLSKVNTLLDKVKDKAIVAIKDGHLEVSEVSAK